MDGQKNIKLSKMYIGLHVKYPLFLPVFNETQQTQALDPNDIQAVQHYLPYCKANVTPAHNAK